MLFHSKLPTAQYANVAAYLKDACGSEDCFALWRCLGVAWHLRTFEPVHTEPEHAAAYAERVLVPA